MMAQDQAESTREIHLPIPARYHKINAANQKDIYKNE